MIAGFRTSVLIASVLLASGILAGCSSGTSTPQQTAPTATEPPDSSASPAPTPEPDPELVHDGTADENLPYFDFVNEKMLVDGNPGGRPLIDNLVSAGFDKSAMQVTADRTPLGRAVDSLQFSVQIGDQCLIGQAGGAYDSFVAPVMQSGGCLLGETRPIDW